MSSLLVKVGSGLSLGVLVSWGLLPEDSAQFLLFKLFQLQQGANAYYQQIQYYSPSAVNERKQRELVLENKRAPINQIRFINTPANSRKIRFLQDCNLQIRIAETVQNLDYEGRVQIIQKVIFKHYPELKEGDQKNVEKLKKRIEQVEKLELDE